MTTQRVADFFNGLMALMLAIGLVAVVSGIAQGKDAETPAFNDVISASMDPVFAVDDWTTVKQSQWDAWVAEALGVYEDTLNDDVPMGCSHYAGVVYSYLYLLRESYTSGKTPLYDGAYLIFNTMDEASVACWMAE
jgi:hypothetical protein